VADPGPVESRALAAARAIVAGPWSDHGSASLTEYRGSWCLRLATGGWSGNEEALDGFPIELRTYWRMSARGGLHIYGIGRCVADVISDYAQAEKEDADA